MPHYSKTIQRVIDELGRLPGIGSRTAERLAFHLLKAPEAEAISLAQSIHDLKTQIRPCATCFNPTEEERCNVCSDPNRQSEMICVVEQPKDLLAFESTGDYRGVYHVLMGHIAPLEGIDADDLTIEALLQRVAAGGVTEVILATNPTVAGDVTNLYLAEKLAEMGTKVTRLARGLPAGGQIEYANKTILSDALTERREM